MSEPTSKETVTSSGKETTSHPPTVFVTGTLNHPPAAAALATTSGHSNPPSPSLHRSTKAHNNNHESITVTTSSPSPSSSTTAAAVTTSTSTSSPNNSSHNIASSSSSTTVVGAGNLNNNLLGVSNMATSTSSTSSLLLASSTGSTANLSTSTTSSSVAAAAAALAANNYHTEEFQFALENKKTLKRLLKISKHWTDSMKVYCQNSHLFSEELIKQSDQMIGFNQQKERNLGNNLSYFGNTIKAVNSVHDQMLNEIQDVFITPVANFVDYDFAEVVDSHKRVSKSKEDYDIALGKISASIKKSKAVDETRLFTYEQELEKLKDVLENQNKELEVKLNELSHKNETKYLRSLLHFINAQYLFFNRASKLYSNLKPRIEELERYLEEIQPPKVVEGHLMKKSKQVMGGWNKCWYVLKDGMLYCYKGKKEFHPENALNILLCSVRLPQLIMSSPSTSTLATSLSKGEKEKTEKEKEKEKEKEREKEKEKEKDEKEYNLRFEILHPRKKQPIVLQAESEEERDRWVEAIQQAISNSLNSQSLEKSHSGVQLAKPMSSSSVSSQSSSGNTTGTDEVNQQIVRILQRVPGNGVCADCSSADPDWASINLGLLICKVCSGVHRSLGTHISKVRSLTLDKWSPDNISLMCEIGNSKFNQLYEHQLGETPKPSDKSDRMTKEQYIRAKYKSRDFITKSSLSVEELGKMLVELASGQCRDVLRYIKLMGQGADVNSTDADGRNALHHSIWRSDDIVVPELLLQNSADITATDSRGWTPMHYAAFFNRPRCAHLLMRRGFEAVRAKCRDHLGRLAIDLAALNHSKETEKILRGEELHLGLTMDAIENGTVAPFESSVPISTDFPKEEILSEDDDDKDEPINQKDDLDSWTSENESVGRASFSQEQQVATSSTDQQPSVIINNNTKIDLNSSFNSSHSGSFGDVKGTINDDTSSTSTSTTATNPTTNVQQSSTSQPQPTTSSNNNSSPSLNGSSGTAPLSVSQSKLNRPKSNRRPSILGKAGRNTLRLVKNKFGKGNSEEGKDGGSPTSSLANVSSNPNEQDSDDEMAEEDVTEANPTGDQAVEDSNPKQLAHRESMDSVISTASVKSRTLPPATSYSQPPSHTSSYNDLTQAEAVEGSPNKQAGGASTGGSQPTPFKIFLKKFKGISSSGGKKNKDKSATSPPQSNTANATAGGDKTDMSTESSQTDEGYDSADESLRSERGGVANEDESKKKPKSSKPKKEKNHHHHDNNLIANASSNTSPAIAPQTNPSNQSIEPIGNSAAASSNTTSQ